MTSTDSAAQKAPDKAPAKDPWDLPDVSGLVVGVLGGTGPQGKGLAYRLAKAGQKVIVAPAPPSAPRPPPRRSGTASRVPTTPRPRAAATS